MKVPFIDLSGQHRQIRKELLKAYARIIDNQHFVLGESVRKLEEIFADRFAAADAVGVASGTDALYLTLKAMGIGPGDEVITTPFSFFASASMIAQAGARPVFADIDAKTFNIDPDRVRAKMTRRTKAVIAVHLFGLPADMPRLGAAARKAGVKLIEDAAQAFGAGIGDKPVGSFGDAACFSFYPTKNLGGAGDGGLITVRNAPLGRSIRVLRDHGQTKKYFHESIGINSRLDELQAATLLVKLKKIEGWNASRRRIAARYDAGLKGLPLGTPFVPKNYRSVYHLYSIRTAQPAALKAYLAEHGIGSGVYYPVPLHLQPCFKHFGFKEGQCPEAERASREILSLPMFAEMTDAQTDAVIRRTRQFFTR